MLHQYSDQPFADLGNHYSTKLNSCSSYLLNQRRAETPEAYDLNNCPGEGNDLPAEDAECTDEPSVSSFDVESVFTMGKHLEPNSSDCCEALQDAVMREKLDDTSNLEYIKEEQNNNNVLESVIEDKSQKLESHQENEKITPVASDDTTIAESGSGVDELAHKNDDESKGSEPAAPTATTGCELCDENESTFRLPGFRQAFGSTEIGRFVHQKDFIEQINQQTSFTPLPVSSLPCSSSPIINSSIISATNSPKIRSRYNKRLKVPPHSLPPPPSVVLPPPTDIAGSTSSSWSSCEFDTGEPATSVNSATPSFQTPNGNAERNFNNRPRDTRTRRHNQYGSAGVSSSYFNGDNYYNCASSYYYGGGNGCSEGMNCDYYRYQPNSSYYHNGYSTYSNLHAGYANGYHYSKDYSERHNSMVNSGDMTSCSMSQNCQIDKYHYTSSYNEEHQIPYHYGDKQSNNSISYHQYQPYMPHNQPQLPSQPSYGNYNGYNSYAPVPSFNYY